MSKKDLVQAGSQELTAPGEEYDWGSNESSSQDVVIPKIQLMQGMSKKVIAGENKIGDFIDSVSGELLGSVDKAFEVIPFHMEKIFVVQKHNGKKFVYDHIEKITPTNENAPWEYETKDGKFKRVYTRNFYVLVPGKVLPFVIGFSSTSSKAGKELATEMFVKNTMMKKAPAASRISIGCKLETNDDGTWAIKTIKPVGNTSPEDIALAFQWYQTVKKEETKVDSAEDFS